MTAGGSGALLTRSSTASPGVEDEVDDHLFQTVGDGEDGRQGRGERGLQRDAVHHELAAEQIAGLRHDAVDVRIQQRKIGFAAEGAHVVDDVAGAGRPAR